MNPNNKEFRKLQDRWYKKLKQHGFDDIESSSLKNKDLLPYLRSDIQNALNRKQNKSKLYLIAEQQEYYRTVGHFLYDHKFDNEVEKLIWQYHADGHSLRDTSDLLKNHKIKMGYTKVKEIIHKIRKHMFQYYKESSDE